MHTLIKGVMLLSGLLIGIFIIVVIIHNISWKLYTLIYTNYTWGLYFPYAKFNSVRLFVTITFCILLFCIIFTLYKLRSHNK